VSNVQLGFYVEQPPRGLNVIRTLSDSEYEQYGRSERLLWDFVADYQQFEMVRSSFAQYKQLVHRYVEQYRLDRRWSNVIAGQINHEINRQLRGFFTEFRFFLDYAERKLQRQYGKKSRQAKEFKERHRIYKLLRLGVRSRPERRLQITGVFAQVAEKAEQG
jgi:hypothetical protein